MKEYFVIECIWAHAFGAPCIGDNYRCYCINLMDYRAHSNTGYQVRATSLSRPPNASHTSQDLGRNTTIIATLIQACSYNRLNRRPVTLCDCAQS